MPNAMPASWLESRRAAGVSPAISAVLPCSWRRQHPTMYTARFCPSMEAGWRADATARRRLDAFPRERRGRVGGVGVAGMEEDMQYQFDFSALLPYWSDFLSGALVTIEITVFSV